MQEYLRSAPPFAISLAVHGGILAALLAIPMIVPPLSPEITLESIFTEEIPREQMEEQLELETKPTETLNLIAGGTPSANVGAASQPAATPVDVQQADVLQEATVDAPAVESMMMSDELLTAELGEGEVTGEVGAMVEGYGAAMGIITQEILRMMREQPVTVVWLFDESGSLVDDRKEIRENYMRVYDELGIARKQEEKKGSRRRREGDQLLTVVASYGKTIHELTPKPTGNVEMIKAAIDKVPEDPSGQENMCQSVREIILKYSAMAKKRKLAIILVSDESGDDGDYVEEAVIAARRAKAPIYVMGRESMFGYPYGRQRYVYEDKKEEIKETFWLQVRRGPETAYPECLQWDGLERNWGGQSAGFGPYEQVRMAKETGGIFFVLPGNEANLVTRDENDLRKYEFLALRPYTPLLLSRQEYLIERETSDFRKAIWNVVLELNPQKNELLFGDRADTQLLIKRDHYPLSQAEFTAVALGQVKKAAYAMNRVNQAIALLEDVQPMRAREASERWRAAYDLAYAQLHIFRLRLFQFMLQMDQHSTKMPKPKNPKSNEWNFWRNKKTITPNEGQFSRVKQSFGITMNRDEYLKMVAEQERKTHDLLQQVMTEHSDTPWARRASNERNSGYGYVVSDRLWDPKGVRNTIRAKLPKL